MDIQDQLERCGYRVLGPTHTFEDALAILKGTDRPALAILDVRLRGDRDGIELGGEIHRLLDIPIVYLSAYADEQTVKRALETRPSAFVKKPVTMGILLRHIERALAFSG